MSLMEGLKTASGIMFWMILAMILFAVLFGVINCVVAYIRVIRRRVKELEESKNRDD